MKALFFLITITFLFQFYSLAQYITNPLIDTNIYQIEMKMNLVLPQEDTEDDGPRTQFKRWKYYWEPKLFPSGNFRPAYHALSDYTNNFSNENRISSTIQANWNNLGPSYPTDPTPTSVNVGGVGRVTCLTFHPTNNNIIFAGTEHG